MVSAHLRGADVPASRVRKGATPPRRRRRRRAQVAFAVDEAVATPFSAALAVTAPGALPAGGRAVAAEEAAPDAAEAAPAAPDDAGGAAAEAPLTATLDDEWRVAWSDERQRPFYHNVATGRSQWTPPLSVG